MAAYLKKSPKTDFGHKYFLLDPYFQKLKKKLRHFFDFINYKIDARNI